MTNPLDITITCKPGQVGPFYQWKNENYVESFDFQTGLPEIDQVCMDVKDINQARAGKIITENVIVNGLPFNEGRWNYLFNISGPPSTDLRFDTLNTAYVLENYISYLTNLGLYTYGFKEFIGGPDKHINVQILTEPEANAAFSPHGMTIKFGHIPGFCNTGSDNDVIIHEFGHLDTFFRNTLLGFLNDEANIEGPAMNESLSDIVATLSALDEEVGESVAVCFARSSRLSKDKGIRTVYETNTRLIPTDESHTRSEEIYSPFLWGIFSKYVQHVISRHQFSGDEESVKRQKTELAKKVRDIMTILVYNMKPYIPSNPKKSDFVRAFVNSLDDFRKNPKLMHKHGNFFAPDYISKLVAYEAMQNQILKTSTELRRYPPGTYEDLNVIFDEQGNYTKALYPELPQGWTPKHKLAELAQQGKGLFDFFEALSIKSKRDLMLYVQVTPQGEPVIGAGIRFIKTSTGYKYIDMTVDPSEIVVAESTLTPETAWAKFSSESGIKKAIADVRKLNKAGTIDKRSKNKIEHTLRSLLRTARPGVKKVYLKGYKNPFYQYKLKDLVIYVDAMTGESKFSQKMYF